MDGTMRYCADLAVDPEDVIMLALAWFTKAPTMGRFARSGWFEAWQTVRCGLFLRFRSARQLADRPCE